MIYDSTHRQWKPAAQNGMSLNDWNRILVGDHDVVMKTHTTKESMSYREALERGAIEEVAEYIKIYKPDHFGRSAPFWGFYEYILWEELKIGAHVNDELLIRKEIVEFWLESPKLWIVWLRHGTKNEGFSPWGNEKFPIEKDYIMRSPPDGNVPRPNALKFQKLWYLHGKDIVNQPESKN